MENRGTKLWIFTGDSYGIYEITNICYNNYDISYSLCTIMGPEISKIYVPVGTNLNEMYELETFNHYMGGPYTLVTSNEQLALDWITHLEEK